MGQGRTADGLLIFQRLHQLYMEINMYGAVNAKTTPINIVNWQFFANGFNSSQSVFVQCQNLVGVPLMFTLFQCRVIFGND
jgi:hypothetical protein